MLLLRLMLQKTVDVTRFLWIILEIKNPLNLVLIRFAGFYWSLMDLLLVELGGFEPPSEKRRPSVLHV